MNLPSSSLNGVRATVPGGRMPSRNSARVTGVRGLEAALAALLVLTFATGGGAQDHGPGDVLAQLFALPVLVLAALALAGQPLKRLHAWALVVATFVVALPALQLLPVPASLAAQSAGRAALLRDLQAAGVVPSLSWTLTPAATERALWSQLPALAAFCGAIALGSLSRLRLSWLVLGLITAGLVLGVLQMFVGQESLLNPFPEWVPVIGGVFANPNHQASALVIGGVLGTGLWLVHRTSGAHGSPWPKWVAATCAVLCLLALPATGSRAGMLLGVPAVLAVLAASRAVPAASARLARHRRVALAAGVGAVLVCGALAAHLFHRTMDTEARWPMATATAELARDAWPLGTGVGSFRPWFEQAGPDALLSLEFINHAHNEYVQWWLEGGVVAIVLLVAALVTLAVAVRRLLARRAGPVNQAAWVGVAVLLASSMVDYPLRTAALMTIGAFLAGIAIGRAGRAGHRSA